MPDDGRDTERTQIPTNLRLLLMLEKIAKAGTPVTASTLSEALAMPKPTVHRLLATADDQGWVTRDVDSRAYGPGHRLRKLASNILSSERVRSERLIVMTELASKVGETCNLAAPDRYGMTYLDRVETHWPLRIQLPIGTQVPFHCTASGKMYLSFLRPDKLRRLLPSLDLRQFTDRSITNPVDLQDDIKRIQSRQYATDNEEFMHGMVAIAVPIKDDLGRLLSTLSIHAPTQRYSLKKLEAKLPDLASAARQLEQLTHAPNGSHSA